MESCIKILRSLQTPGGLFLAAPSADTGYDKAWIRDNVYASFGPEIFNPDKALVVYHKIFDILKKHEYKIDHAIEKKPSYNYQYIHARYHPETLEEFHEEWGNKQHDAVGLFLFKCADLIDKGFQIIRDESDIKILEKLVRYLGSVEYWHDKDNGIWEENEEVHASSVGACLAGLKAVSKYLPVDRALIEKGRETLDKLLPNESETKDADLALLSLIYPYNIVDEIQKETILKNVEEKLVRKRGVIRYVGDRYYNVHGEAEWTMGFPWLAIIYKNMKNKAKFEHYMKKTIECMNEQGELPELYFANSKVHNKNSPLGWAQSLYIVAAL
jgi:GH15 family glucan-1,4-alpha-glucosidase